MSGLYSDCRGFMVAEVLLVAVVSTLLLVGVSSLVVQGQEVYGRESAAIEVRQSTRVPLMRMTREIRMAGYNMGNVPQMILRAGPVTLGIAADLDDGDPGGECTKETGGAGVEGVYYELQGGRLERSVRCWNGATWPAAAPAVSLVVDNVQTQRLFRYFAEDGTELGASGVDLSAAERDLVAAITIDLDVTDTPPPAASTVVSPTKTEITTMGGATSPTSPTDSYVVNVYPTQTQRLGSPRAAVHARVVLRNRGLDPTLTRGS